MQTGLYSQVYVKMSAHSGPKLQLPQHILLTSEVPAGTAQMIQSQCTRHTLVQVCAAVLQV